MTKDMFLEQAAGRAEADLRIDNAVVADVFSGEFFPSSVCVGQGRILGFSRLPAREVVDAGGAYLLPGFIDGHVHIESSMLCPARFAELVLPRGTTTVIADPHEIANVKGLDGVRYMLDASRGLPLDVRVMLPSCVPALPAEDAGAVLTAEDLAAFLASLPDAEKVAGLGEMMNVPGVLSGDPDVLEKIRAARSRGRQVDGHSPGLSGEGLDMYSAAGVGTDHECTTVEELRDRIRRGMYVLLREGSASRDLLRLLPGVTPENSRRCLFCTDDRQPADILERGHMDSHLRIAVDAGIDAMSAVRMATLNAAECYGLRDRGGIAPGLRADLVLVEDLQSFRPRKTWAGGRLVAEDGVMKSELPHADPEVLRHSVNLAPLPERPFGLRLPSGRARVISLLPHSLVTECREMEVQTGPDGLFDFAQNPGLLKIAVLERHHATGKIGVGLLDGTYGLTGGAIATTIAHDSHNIVVAGDNDADMKLAVEEIVRLGGGVVMVSRGRVLDSLPLPLGGLMSERPAREVADALRRLLRLAREHYHISENADAFMTLSFLALPVIPRLKITARGLFDVDAFSFVPVEA